MLESIPSLHVIGSRQFGGAEHFYVRLVRALHETRHPVAAINRPDSPVAGTLARDGIEQFHLPFVNGWDILTMWRLRRLAASREPCIDQTYMGRATRLTRLPAGSRAIHVARLGGYYKINGYYRHAHAWIGNTRGICDYLVRCGLPSGRVFHIGNFVPPPPELPPVELDGLRATWQIPRDSWTLFSLGRFVEKKGFADLLQALALMPRQVAGRDIVMLIAGDGPRAGELQALAAHLGLADRIRWLGWQDTPDGFYRLADLFVCPSREEPLGNVILEAWNHGLPVVSTRTAGALELITEGNDGLLSRLGEPKNLAERLMELLAATAAQRTALGEAGRQQLHARFGQTAILEAYLSLYERLMSKGAA